MSDYKVYFRDRVKPMEIAGAKIERSKGEYQFKIPVDLPDVEDQVVVRIPMDAVLVIMNPSPGEGVKIKQGYDDEDMGTHDELSDLD